MRVTARVLSVPFLFIQPPAVLEPTYARSTFMDNCTPISLKAEGALYPASPRELARPRRRLARQRKQWPR